MDDPNNNSLLPANTEFVNPEGGAPAPDIIPEVPIEAPASAPPAPDPTKTTEGPRLPDREALLDEVGQKIEIFFGFTRDRSGRIQESVGAINKSKEPMEILRQRGSLVKGTLREMHATRLLQAKKLPGEQHNRLMKQLAP